MLTLHEHIEVFEHQCSEDLKFTVRLLHWDFFIYSFLISWIVSNIFCVSVLDAWTVDSKSEVYPLRKLFQDCIMTHPVISPKVPFPNVLSSFFLFSKFVAHSSGFLHLDSTFYQEGVRGPYIVFLNTTRMVRYFKYSPLGICSLCWKHFRIFHLETSIKK